jgi:alpha-L-fucosidase
VNCNFETASGPTPYSVGQDTVPHSEVDPFVDSLQKATLLSDSLQKAASLLDSLQKAYVAMKFGMFFHFNMSTFDRYNFYSVSGEWGVAGADEKKFNPTALNCGQWADVAKSAGCKYMVLTSKHHDGFCVWPSKYTAHCISKATVTRDVVKEFVDSARVRGMQVGLYYSIRDYTNGYAIDFVKGQLAELLTNYGPLVCLWFDGWGWGPGYNKVPYDTVRNLIKRLQPKCLMIENNHKFTIDHTEIIEYEMPIDGPPGVNNVLPAEGCQVIRTAADHCWFWHPIDECTMMPAQTIVDELSANNSRNAAYLFDLTPDTTGNIPQCQADRMREVGQLRGVTP